MPNNFLKTTLIIGYCSLYVNFSQATSCGHLETHITNHSDYDWQYNKAESSYGESLSTDGTTAITDGNTYESSDPNNYAYIFPDEDVTINFHNSRKNYHLYVFSVYNSGHCLEKDSSDSRLCTDFAPDGGRVKFYSFRDKDGRSDYYADIHVQVHGDIESGNELSQYRAYKQTNAKCGNEALGHNDRAGKTYFSLLDLTKQDVSVDIKFNTEQQAAMVAEGAYTYLNPESLFGLDQVYGEPIRVEHTPGNTNAIFSFRRACSAQQAEKAISECVNGGESQETCEADSCYYQDV